MAKAVARVSAIRRNLLLCLAGVMPIWSSCLPELELAVKLAAADYVNFAVDAWADSAISNLAGADDANADANSAGDGQSSGGE